MTMHKNKAVRLLKMNVSFPQTTAYSHGVKYCNNDKVYSNLLEICLINYNVLDNNTSQKYNL